MKIIINTKEYYRKFVGNYIFFPKNIRYKYSIYLVGYKNENEPINNEKLICSNFKHVKIPRKKNFK